MVQLEKSGMMILTRLATNLIFLRLPWWGKDQRLLTQTSFLSCTPVLSMPSCLQLKKEQHFKFHPLSARLQNHFL